MLKIVSGKWSALCYGRFTSMEKIPVSTGLKSNWAVGSLWTSWRRENFKFDVQSLHGIQTTFR
jgi:hypothetical protein